MLCPCHIPKLPWPSATAMPGILCADASTCLSLPLSDPGLPQSGRGVTERSQKARGQVPQPASLRGTTSQVTGESGLPVQATAWEDAPTLAFPPVLFDSFPFTSTASEQRPGWPTQLAPKCRSEALLSEGKSSPGQHAARIGPQAVTR